MFIELQNANMATPPLFVFHFSFGQRKQKQACCCCLFASFFGSTPSESSFMNPLLLFSWSAFCLIPRFSLTPLDPCCAQAIVFFCLSSYSFGLLLFSSSDSCQGRRDLWKQSPLTLFRSKTPLRNRIRPANWKLSPIWMVLFQMSRNEILKEREKTATWSLYWKIDVSSWPCPGTTLVNKLWWWWWGAGCLCLVETSAMWAKAIPGERYSIRDNEDVEQWLSDRYI